MGESINREQGIIRTAGRLQRLTAGLDRFGDLPQHVERDREAGERRDTNPTPSNHRTAVKIAGRNELALHPHRFGEPGRRTGGEIIPTGRFGHRQGLRCVAPQTGIVQAPERDRAEVRQYLPPPLETVRGQALQRCLQIGSRLRPHPDAGQRTAPARAQIRDAVALTQALGHPDRPGQQSRLLAMSRRSVRPLGGPDQVVEGALLVRRSGAGRTARGGQPSVVRAATRPASGAQARQGRLLVVESQSFVVGVQSLAIQPLDRLGHLLVQRGALAPKNTLVDRLLHEHVAEGVFLLRDDPLLIDEPPLLQLP
jgi:hypothetical protein